MISYIFERDGSIHIINYNIGMNTFMTMCDQCIHKNEKISILSINHRLQNMICNICYSNYEESNNFRFIRNRSKNNFKHIRYYHYKNTLGPKVRHNWRTLRQRSWQKLARGKSKIFRKNKYNEDDI